MGAGASIDDGAMASLPPDVVEKYREAEKLKNEMAAQDAKFIRHQSTQMWKNHQSIISLFTERSKSQLRRCALLYQQSEDMGGFNTKLEDEIHEMLGGNYGDFMRLLVLRREDIDIENLDTALMCIGCEESILVDVLCACTPVDLQRLGELFKVKHKITLASKIKSKTSKDSVFQRFMVHILENTRDGDDVTDNSIVASQAEAFHNALAAGENRDDAAVFDLIGKISREQFALINEAYFEKYKSSLDVALTEHFPGQAGRAIKLFTSRLSEAIATIFHNALGAGIVDFDTIAYLTAKYDKVLLREVCKQYIALFNEDFTDALKQNLIGNFRKCVIAWVSSDPADGGFTERISNLIGGGESIAAVLSAKFANADTAKRISDYVEEEIKALAEYKSKHPSEGTDAKKKKRRGVNRSNISPKSNGAENAGVNFLTTKPDTTSNASKSTKADAKSEPTPKEDAKSPRPEAQKSPRASSASDKEVDVLKNGDENGCNGSIAKEKVVSGTETDAAAKAEIKSPRGSPRAETATANGTATTPQDAVNGEGGNTEAKEGVKAEAKDTTKPSDNPKSPRPDQQSSPRSSSVKAPPPAPEDSNTEEPVAETEELPPPPRDETFDEGDSPGLLDMQSKFHDTTIDHHDYERKYKLVAEFLVEEFLRADVDKSGALDSSEFWPLMRSLDVGYTDDEIAAIESWADFDGDGVITYTEIINELAESLIYMIEGAGDVVDDKIAHLRAISAEKYGSVDEENLSPDLWTYLKDSFDAYDVDKNGTLNPEEFWQIIVAVLGLSDGDKEDLQVMEFSDVR